MSITTEQCVAILHDAFVNKPNETYSETALNWFADVAGAVSAYSPSKAIRLKSLLPRIGDTGSSSLSPVFATARDTACTGFFMEARALYAQLRLETNAFTTVQVERGEVHSYFEEIRQIIATTTQDILFIDAHIDAEFVTRYLPQIPEGVVVRLLTSQSRGSAVGASLALFRQQHQLRVELRVVPNQSVHDRHLVIDGRDVWQSGASFKDGAKNAPTSINQIVDVAVEMIRAHEARWAAAREVP